MRCRRRQVAGTACLQTEPVLQRIFRNCGLNTTHNVLQWLPLAQTAIVRRNWLASDRLLYWQEAARGCPVFCHQSPQYEQCPKWRNVLSPHAPTLMDYLSRSHPAWCYHWWQFNYACYSYVQPNTRHGLFTASVSLITLPPMTSQLRLPATGVGNVCCSL